MLVNCKPGCSGKKVNTNALLDLDTNEVLCDFCGEEIQVTSFTKNSMKSQGDVVRNTKKKSFQFDCATCGKNVPTHLDGKTLKGDDCDKECKFNVSKFAMRAMEQSASSKISDEGTPVSSGVEIGKIKRGA